MEIQGLRITGLPLTMHSSSLWLIKVKPSKKPKHIPSPHNWAQERLECETLCEILKEKLELLHRRDRGEQLF